MVNINISGKEKGRKIIRERERGELICYNYITHLALSNYYIINL